MRPPPHGPPHVESRTELGYTVSASGTSSASPQGFVAEELSPIQSPDAHDSCERSGLAYPCNKVPWSQGAKPNFQVLDATQIEVKRFCCHISNGSERCQPSKMVYSSAAGIWVRFTKPPVISVAWDRRQARFPGG